MWQVTVSGSARERIKRFPKTDQKRILDSLDDLKKDPFDHDLIKLKGEESVWRLRVGNYRIKFELFQKEKAIFVFEVKRRTSTTY